ncbi:MAG: bifunctional SulP family inorganic anion transporter/carbonic anhydrase, partial [Daejeonella sp.]
RLKEIKFFPPSLFVVLLSIGINKIFQAFIPDLYIHSEHLVNIPSTNIADLATFFKFPAVSSFSNYDVWLTAITLAIVASLETLLNLEAVDNIDPHKRQSPPNRELVAQGIANMIAGFVGGLPVTSVIVRSSVNINAGAHTKLSTILHGVLLLAAILFLSPVINFIPFAALAAILIVTGYKLAKISIFKEMHAKGLNQVIPFVATIVAIIFTDLLIGILIGLAISLFYLLKSNYRNPFTIEKEHLFKGETIRIELPNQVSFLNKASIKDTLWSIPKDTNVIVDASYSDYIDYDVLELLVDFKKVIAPENNIKLNIIGIKEEYNLSDHIQFVNVLDRQAQEQLTPEDIVAILKKGNVRFTQGKWSEKYFRHQVNATSSGQYPMAVVISCIDSRTSPELIFDANLGDLISIRIAGNIVNKEIIGSIELALKEMGTKLVVIMGHSNCGAVGAALSSLTEGNIGSITQKIKPAIDKVQLLYQGNGNSNDSCFYNKVSRTNIDNSIAVILENSRYIQEKNSKGRIGIVAAYYDTATGEVIFN